MTVSICTTTARAGFVHKQAQYIANQLHPDFDIEWVLVDFAMESRAALIKKTAVDLNLHIRHVPNVRTADIFFRDISRNRNQALKYATGDYIIFIDDFALIPPDFIMNHLEIMKTGTISCGQMYRLEDDLNVTQTPGNSTLLEDQDLLWPSDINHYLSPDRAFKVGIDHRARGTQVYKANGITYTGNLGMPRGIAEVLNGFDPRMEGALEDCDFGLRAAHLGFLTFFTPAAYTINLNTGRYPYVFSFDHVHDVEPFISNPNNNFRGDANLLENDSMRIEFCDHYRIAHCKTCGARGMIDPNELIQHKLTTRTDLVTPEVAGSLSFLRKY